MTTAAKCPETHLIFHIESHFDPAPRSPLIDNELFKLPKAKKNVILLGLIKYAKINLNMQRLINFYRCC